MLENSGLVLFVLGSGKSQKTELLSLRSLRETFLYLDLVPKLLFLYTVFLIFWSCRHAMHSWLLCLLCMWIQLMVVFATGFRGFTPIWNSWPSSSLETVSGSQLSLWTCFLCCDWQLAFMTTDVVGNMTRVMLIADMWLWLLFTDVSYAASYSNIL